MHSNQISTNMPSIGSVSNEIGIAISELWENKTYIAQIKPMAAVRYVLTSLPST